MEPEKKPTIDERLEALVHTAELMQAHGRWQARKIRRLTILSEQHEREQERFRRIMRAAMNEFLNGENGETGE